ncbi:RHS repeat-associated core domain-containing protein [Chryseobacterium indologenes]|uniref:RHS repeat-associated core domain-containing protein n=1 Tax=Chryseobacterium indologenes TaxID=253 RepID=A0A0N0ZVJ1_CHRID|nr:RHS repeat-associated core domain-containing protein [Chryseobacterium indologenes]KPE49005.1 hypothetical protein AOB46_22380 [Chryseobacterium indologenes]
MGTAAFVTDANAVATQFFVNLPFGETFVEQQVARTYENPYKFNAKELDSETGLYYYGARYYNPRLSFWYGVDPLAIYNPVMEREFYGDGQHNGGVNFWGNLNPYIYTYQSPIRYIDPNGKQTDVVYLQKKGTDTIIRNASDDIRNKKNVLTITSHGGTHGARLYDQNGKKGGLIDGPVSFRKNMEADSEKWRKRKENGNLVVVMYACNIARDRVDKEGNSKPTRLQSISAGNPDEVFIGSTTSVGYSDNGFIDQITGPVDNGKYRVYKAGILIDEYDSSWDPNTFKSKWFDNPKEIKSNDKTKPAVNDQIQNCTSCAKKKK